MRHYTRAERIFIHCCHRSHAGNRRRKHFNVTRRRLIDRIHEAEIIDALWYNDEED